ncbi:MAG: 23S rRNA (adenine(2503)-C(2))-methyltransferase RlmN [Rickettsiales bacterium]|jgi:23S rRNA (adenine2503-C2)-methyltransferase|nr:23S rRNA (adenine(2503)-C(2))-methyltransferase RlmN [Rickettsiales bacterium]
MQNLYSKSLSEIEKIVSDLGEPKFRAKQIREWLDRGCPDFLLMKNIGAPLQSKLSESFQSLPIKDQSVLASADGATKKFLFEIEGGAKIESVLMKTSYGNSVCVSSQAGCAMGCRFCASTLLGLSRNLTADEMTAQVLRCQWECRQDGTRPNGDKNQNDITHIVIMGTGEPLANYDNTIAFMAAANEKLNIGWRRITLSTCGLVPEIRRLRDFGEPINLAISLHAPNDALRREIMPIANKYSIAETLDAAFEFSTLHNRQLMIEYILLGGVNDSDENAAELAALLRGKLVMVNLIPWNPVAERDWAAAPSGNRVHKFQDILIAAGVHTRIRKERGADIGSACGQLRLGK